MNTKQIVTAVLLVFAAVSILAIGFKGGTEKIEKPEAVTNDRGEPYTGVIAYYFHKTKRCATCQKIETYSKDVVTGAFGPMIEEGKLRWVTVNIDLPENKHFVDDFELFANALVLARIEDGKRTGFYDLDQIWERVNDQNDFKAYVQGSLVSFMTPNS